MGEGKRETEKQQNQGCKHQVHSFGAMIKKNSIQ